MEETVEKLYRSAKSAVKMAIAPYSRFKVGVAVITADERIFTGCNFENPSLMMSECAERVAILKALSEGAQGIRAIMIVANRGDYRYPCGLCRQLILEFAPDAEIYVAGKRGVKKHSIEELLPHGLKS
jgi:cytidine deaminase